MKRINNNIIRTTTTNTFTYVKKQTTRTKTSNSESTDTVTTVTNRICKILINSPTSTLEVALTESGLRVSPEVVESVLSRFQNAGTVAFRFFQWAEKHHQRQGYLHSVRAYHLVIEAMAKIKLYKIVWELVGSMKKKGLLNVETFCIIMRKYARVGKVDEAIYTFNVMEKYGVDSNLAALNGLISALCKAKNVRNAQDVFTTVKDRFEVDTKTYSILIDGWGRAPNLGKAREVFREMVSSGCEPDVVTYGIMVDVLCKAGRVDEAIGIVREMESKGCKPSSFIYSVLVHTYGVENRIGDAVEAFLEMEKSGIEADVVVYNALIGAFCKANKFKNVYRVLNEMESKGVTPNSRTCNVIISNLIARGEIDEAFGMFRRMMKVCEADSDTYTMIIKMFCEKRKLDMALKVWKYMKSKKFVPSMHTFQVLINGLCEKGDASQACVLLEEMIEKGIQPSGVTFGRLRQLLLKDKREDVLKFLQDKIKVMVSEPFFD